MSTEHTPPSAEPQPDLPTPSTGGAARWPFRGLVLLALLALGGYLAYDRWEQRRTGALRAELAAARGRRDPAAIEQVLQRALHERSQLDGTPFRRAPLAEKLEQLAVEVRGAHAELLAALVGEKLAADDEPGARRVLDEAGERIDRTTELMQLSAGLQAARAILHARVMARMRREGEAALAAGKFSDAAVAARLLERRDAKAGAALLDRIAAAEFGAKEQELRRLLDAKQYEQAYRQAGMPGAVQERYGKPRCKPHLARLDRLREEAVSATAAALAQQVAAHLKAGRQAEASAACSALERRLIYFHHSATLKQAIAAQRAKVRSAELAGLEQKVAGLLAKGQRSAARSALSSAWYLPRGTQAAPELVAATDRLAGRELATIGRQAIGGDRLGALETYGKARSLFYYPVKLSPAVNQQFDALRKQVAEAEIRDIGREIDGLLARGQSDQASRRLEQRLREIDRRSLRHVVTLDRPSLWGRIWSAAIRGKSSSSVGQALLSGTLSAPEGIPVRLEGVIDLRETWWTATYSYSTKRGQMYGPRTYHGIKTLNVYALLVPDPGGALARRLADVQSRARSLDASAARYPNITINAYNNDQQYFRKLYADCWPDQAFIVKLDPKLHAALYRKYRSEADAEARKAVARGGLPPLRMPRLKLKLPAFKPPQMSDAERNRRIIAGHRRLYAAVAGWRWQARQSVTSVVRRAGTSVAPSWLKVKSPLLIDQTAK